MHAKTIVARVLGPCLGSIHIKRARALMRATTALVRGGITSLSAIALRLDANTTLKHRLKSVDRLLGNTALHQQRCEIYRALAQHWLEDVTQILVVVDWSDHVFLIHFLAKSARLTRVWAADLLCRAVRVFPMPSQSRPESVLLPSA